MKITKEIKKNSFAVKLDIVEKEKCLASAYLYVLSNDLHPEPFGFLENVFVEESHRGAGLGTKLVKAAIAEAKKLGCYKVIGTSRTSREQVHRFYERLGFQNYGLEFRIDFKKGVKKNTKRR